MPTGESREVALVFAMPKDSQELERTIELEVKVLGAAASETSFETCIYAPSNIGTQCGPP
ncbi:hypothetical protein BS17DRAFT_789007 [Gyrodon lividus]|nr:hypothetical protein BS17DRAFT_789007 [Gyrodon lividus]